MSAHHTVLWLSVLLAAIVAAIVGTIIDNVVKGASERKHNSVLLLNECLAEHQIAYLLFFVTLATGASFTKYWGTPLVQVSIVLSLAFYVKGVHSTTRHERKIASDHICSEGCGRNLKIWTMVKICAMNIVFTILMLLISCYLSVITVHDPTGQ